MNKFTPLILLFGILFNSVCVLVFRLKQDHRYKSDFDILSSTLKNQVSSFSSDALSRIDNYFTSNNINRVSSSHSPSGSVRSSTPTLPLFKTSGEWSYVFWLYDGHPRARVVDGFCSLDYKVGDFFPRGGGRITSIHPDGVSVDNNYWFNNRSLRLNSSSTSKPETYNHSTNNPTSRRYELATNRMR